VEQLQHIPNVRVAFDSDDAGNAAARAAKKLLPQSKRLKCKAVYIHAYLDTQLVEALLKRLSAYGIAEASTPPIED